MDLRIIGSQIPSQLRSFVQQLQPVTDGALFDIATRAREDFQKTTETWTDQPEFDIVKTAKGYTVSTDDEIFGYVDRGTPPHQITGRFIVGHGPSRMFFQPIYKPKTFPRQIFSQSGGSSGPTVVAQVVQHPGIQARQFSDTILNQWQYLMTQYLIEALRGLVKSTGMG